MEMKPWYHGVKWVPGIQRSVMERQRQVAQIIVTNGDYEAGTRELLLVHSTPETAQQRDELLSVQKQLVENLERVTSHLESWRRDDTDGQATAETEACLFCARAAILAAKATS